MECDIYRIEKSLRKCAAIEKDKRYFLLCDAAYLNENADLLSIPVEAVEITKKNADEGMRSNIICKNALVAAKVALPNRKNDITENTAFYFFITAHFFIIVCEKKEFESCFDLKEAVKSLISKDRSVESLELLVYTFWETLLEQDAVYLEKYEREIADFEEQIEDDSESLSFAALLKMRRKLFILKGFYAQLNEVAACLNNTANGLFSTEEALVFKPLTQHTQKLGDNVLVLRENLTQIRQEYNSVMDYNLNKVMKFHTVLTTLFLPLNLIAGWYGMNFDMPEFGFAWAYPLLAVVCILLLCALIMFLKKKKLF